MRCAIFVVLAVVGCRRTHAPDLLYQASAAQASRPVELRMTGIGYAPRARTTRGDTAASAELASTAREVLSSSDTTARDRAFALLVLDQRRAAVTLLQNSTTTNPTAQTWNDLAAALYELGAPEADTETLVQALAAADRALRLDGNLPEARFNRAALLESLGWREAAAAAWKVYLDAAEDSPWRVEARERLQRLQQPTDFQRWPEARRRLEEAARQGQHDTVSQLVREFRQQARTTAEGPLLADWADAHTAGKEGDARSALAVARAVGDALAAGSGELLLKDSVSAAAARPDIVARAHRRYRDARLLIRDRRVTDALPAIAEAEELFRQGQSPMALVAAFYRAGVLFDLNRPVEAHAVLDSVAGHDLGRYHALRAQMLWEEAMRATRRGESYASLPPSAEALALFSRLRETDNSIRLLVNRAASLTLLGRDREAWELRGELFELAGRSGSPEVVESALHTSGYAAIQEHRYDVAHSLLTVLADSPAQSPVRRFDATLLRMLAGIRIGLTSPAELRKLEEAARALPDEELRRDALDELNSIQALLERDPEDAASKFSSSIAYRERKQLLTLPETYAARGEAFRRAGKAPAAMRDFAHALSLYERQRQQIGETGTRDTFFGTADSACRALFEIQVERALEREAFVTAERCRTRVLADVVSPRGAAAAPDPEAIRTSLAEKQRLVHYSVLENAIVVFVLARDRFEMRRLPGSAAATRAAVDELLGAAGRGDEAAFDRHAGSLHATLLAPLQPALAGATELIVVPDEVLAAVPFAALRRPGGRYVVEEHALSVAPSASVYASARRSSRGEGSRITIVADPSFDPAVAGALERLPAARREGTLLGRLYAGATLLAGPDATPEKFLDAAEDAVVIHIGAHALVSARDASLSVFAFAPGGRDGRGLLSLDTISRQNLRRHPLVVLAGCRTAVPGRGRGSIRSLAFAFLAAGAGGAVGSLWNVDDGASGVLSIAFHRRLLGGASATTALRDAQLQMLRSPDQSLRNPTAWGGFQMYGSH
ncbi:MAG TPA: CHAT domain-containing protein [Thermoanaerobaculia bacterium]